jgi:catechol 2,3-dioxygenase-like lactoylglutathione lyase family enzyme
MEIQFVAGFGPIVNDPAAALDLYGTTLGIPFDQDGGYASTGDLEGVKHLGLWPLSDAARSCFGTDTWPADVPTPNAGIEFELASPDAVDEAAKELEAAGHALLKQPGDEPWGQRTARLLDADGLLVGVVHTPFLH